MNSAFLLFGDGFIDKYLLPRVAGNVVACDYIFNGESSYINFSVRRAVTVVNNVNCTVGRYYRIGIGNAAAFVKQQFQA